MEAMRVNTNYITFKLFGLNVLFYTLQQITPLIENLFILYLPHLSSRPWMLISAMFLHGSLNHLFQNMFALLMFGLTLEQIIGKTKFLSVYLVTGIIGNIAGLIFYPAIPSLGASGAIMGVIGALTLLRPFTIVYFVGLPLPLLFLSIAWILIDLTGMIFPEPGIGYAAHVFGFFSGVFIAKYILKRNNYY
ncbi:MAG: rhomboid family intramembrane serine protease [Candidatus Aenigmarchaeota archaeon]|nr:rhomboid family intramembrane serine protease [Candidatus Aenigmarchaeota archaeon]